MRWMESLRVRSAIVVLAGCAIAGACLGAADRGETLPTEPFASLPAFKTDGTSFDIAAQPGWKVVYFWSETCPCVQMCEEVNFIPLARQYQGKVTFYAVASNASNLTMGGRDQDVPVLRLSSVGNRRWPTYSLLLDPKHGIAEALHASFTPETFVLDPENRIVFRGAPDDSTEYEKRTKMKGFTQNFVGDALKEVLAGKKVSHPVSRIGTWCNIDRSDETPASAAVPAEK